MSPWIFTLLLSVALSEFVVDPEKKYCPNSESGCPTCGSIEASDDEVCVTDCGDKGILLTCKDFGMRNGLKMTELQCGDKQGHRGLCGIVQQQQGGQQQVNQDQWHAPKKQIGSDHKKKEEIKTRSYWVINGHSAYIPKDLSVQSNYPTYFFCKFGDPYDPLHQSKAKSLDEVTRLLTGNTEGYDEQRAQIAKNQGNFIAANVEMHDYFIQYCERCGKKSGIFYVTIEDKGQQVTKVTKIVKYDLSKIPHGQGVLLSDLIKTRFGKKPGPIFSLGCRVKLDIEWKDQMKYPVAKIKGKPKTYKAKASDYAEWITDDYLYEDESDAYDGQFEWDNGARYDGKSLHHEHVYGGYEHDRYNGYGEYNYDYEQTKLLLAILLFLFTICIVCIGYLCCAGFGGIAGWFIKDASSASVKNRKNDYIRALNDDTVSEI